MSQPARESRAIFRAIRFAIAPPDVKAPAAPSGMPNICWANHRVSAISISTADGASRQPPAFMLMPAASSSAAAPGTVPAPET